MLARGIFGENNKGISRRISEVNPGDTPEEIHARFPPKNPKNVLKESLEKLFRKFIESFHKLSLEIFEEIFK